MKGISYVILVAIAVSVTYPLATAVADGVTQSFGKATALLKTR